MFKRVPSSYVLLFYIIIVLSIATYFIPAGTYERMIDASTGVNYVVPNTYTVVEKTPVTIFEFFKAIPQGLFESSDIIIFVLIMGGCFGVIQATGLTDAFLGSMIQKHEKYEKTLVIAIMTIFSLAGGMLGTAEEALPFYPIIISLALSMGYDKITGVAILLLGTGSGFAAGFLNPFTTGIAQNLSELPMYSGIVLRMVAHAIFLSTAIIYVLRYIKKIKKEKKQDFETEEDYADVNMPTHLNARQKRVVAVVILAFGILLAGVLKYNFQILDIVTVFFGMAVISGLIGGLKPGRISSEFVKGASNLAYGALIIGFAKGITVVMNHGQIIDTIINFLSRQIEGFNLIESVIGIFVIQTIISVFISSGSGQAAATIPIMKTVADKAGVTRQSGVLAFQFGDGITNLIAPTSGYVIAALALADIEWRDWARWFSPLYVIWLLEGITVLIISALINYGPY